MGKKKKNSPVVAVNPPSPQFGDRPPTDCIELSLFGPGVGESVLVHVAAGKWLIVDSCRDPVDGTPAALKYLRSIGVDPAEAIALCVCTHFHADHTDGMAEIISAAPNSNFAIPAALWSEELMELVGFYGASSSIPAATYSSLGEFRKVLERLSADPSLQSRLQFAGPDRLLMSIGSATVHSLSPSDTARLVMELKIRSFRAKPGLRRRIPGAKGPNDTAVAIFVQSDDRCMLLGSDLEAHANPSMGWKSAHSCLSIGGKRALVFKVPHHGAASSDDPDTWRLLTVQKKVLSVLTTYTPSDLPRPADIHRIKANSKGAFCTSAPKSYRSRMPAVERQIREIGAKLSPLTPALGHIRVRWANGGTPMAEYFGAAGRL